MIDYTCNAEKAKKITEDVLKKEENVTVDEERAKIVVPFAKTPVVADGFIAPGEWDDAQVVVVGYPDSYGYLHVKHNYTFLWVFLDHVTDRVWSLVGYDNGWVAIDPDMSGGSQPQEYDMLFHSHGHLVYIGDGVDPIESSQWGILRGHPPEDTPEKYWPLRDFILASYVGSGPSWGPTEANDTIHVFFELQIPLGVLELIPELGNTTEFGFCASMQDNDAKTIIDWPVTQSTGNFWPGPDSPEGSYAPPDTWGALTLEPPERKNWIPYVYVTTATVVVLIAVLAIVLKVRRKRSAAGEKKA